MDRDCRMPPNAPAFDGLVNRDQRQTRRQANATATQSPSVPAVHVHFSDSPIGRILAPSQHTTPTKHCHQMDPESSDSEGFSDDEAISIKDVLNILHKSRPAINYPQYEPALLKAGIAYATAVQDFPTSFFTGSTVGMPEGAVGDFLRGVKSAIRKGRKRAKRVHFEEDKENDTESALVTHK